MKKGYCFLVMALCMVLVLVPVSQVNAFGATYGYNSDQAISYAASHYNDGVGVCDEFVKACLSAGGVEIRAGGVTEVKNALVDAKFGTSSPLSMSSDGHINKASNTGLKVGDVLFVYCSDCETYVHTAMIAGFDADGNIQAYGHNPAWNLETNFGNMKYTTSDGVTHVNCQFDVVKMDTSAQSHQHSFTHDLYETAHPHRMYDQCSCGAKYYLGWNATVSSCATCNPSTGSKPELSAAYSAANGVSLSWTAIENAGNYEVYRAKSADGSWFLLGTVTATKFTNGSVDAGATYYYKVKAVSANVESNVVSCICSDTENIPHSYDSGKVTQKATCKATGVKTYTCADCGATKTETIAKSTTHTYTNACDTSCNVCGVTRTIAHAYKTTTTKATTTTNGSIVKKCTVCGKVASTTAIKYAKTFSLSTTSYTYNGVEKKPKVTVKDSAGKTLINGTDYTVTYPSGRKNVGTYTVTVTMKGNYSGTKKLTFKINPINVSKCTFSLSTTNYTYNGVIKAPVVTVKNSSGTKLSTSTYTVTYPSGRKNVGTYTVTVKMKGNYSGTKTLTFKINPVKTTVSKLTAGQKSITVGITKKSTQVTGYQIQYSTSSKFTNASTKTITSYKTTKYTLKSLSAKKTYYVRVRTYKTVNGTKYYSGWSTYKYIKTK